MGLMNKRHFGMAIGLVGIFVVSVIAGEENLPSLTVKVRLADTGAIPSSIDIIDGERVLHQISWFRNRSTIQKWDSQTGVFHYVRTPDESQFNYCFRFRVPGYNLETVDFPANATQPIQIELTLKPIKQISGRVIDDQSKKPVAGAIFAVVNSENRLIINFVEDYTSHRRCLEAFSGFLSQSAMDGEFLLPDTEGLSTSKLVVLDPTEGFMVIPDIKGAIRDNRIEISLPRTSTVHGQVIVAGTPVAGEHIRLKYNTKNDWSFSYVGELVTGEDGRFEFRDLGAGEYQLNRVWVLTHQNVITNHYLKGPKITVGAGENVQCDFVIPAGHLVEGRTLIRKDRTLGNCMVFLESASDKPGMNRLDVTKSNSSGEYSLTNVPKGTYRLTAEHSHSPSSGQIGNAQGTQHIEVNGPAKQDILLEPVGQNTIADLMGLDVSIQGKSTPDFSAKLLAGGETFKLSEQKGKRVVILFGLSEEPRFVAFLEKYKTLRKKFDLQKEWSELLVSLDSEEDSLRTLLQKQEMNLPAACSGDGWFDEAASLLGVKSIPTVFVIDTEGNFTCEKIDGQGCAETLERTLEAIK